MLEDQPPAMQHDQRISIGLLEEIVEEQGGCAIRDAYPRQVDGCRGQRPHRVRGVGNISRGHQLPHMLKGPAIMRRLAPIRQGDLSFGGGWEAVH
jgi:hypothetical protein